MNASAADPPADSVTEELEFLDDADDAQFQPAEQEQPAEQDTEELDADEYDGDEHVDQGALYASFQTARDEKAAGFIGQAVEGHVLAASIASAALEERGRRFVAEQREREAHQRAEQEAAEQEAALAAAHREDQQQELCAVRAAAVAAVVIQREGEAAEAAEEEEQDSVDRINHNLREEALANGAILLPNGFRICRRDLRPDTAEHREACTQRAARREAARATAMATAAATTVVEDPRSPQESAGSCPHGPGLPDSPAFRRHR